MNDEQIKNAMGTITYLKTTGEIVGFDNNINTPLSSLLDASVSYTHLTLPTTPYV